MYEPSPTPLAPEHGDGPVRAGVADGDSGWAAAGADPVADPVGRSRPSGCSWTAVVSPSTDSTSEATDEGRRGAAVLA